MKHPFLPASFLVAALLASGAAAACGEGQFNMGQGLRYQNLLAPRPATVLIYSAAGESVAERDALAKALRQSGHSVTVVGDAGEMSSALGGTHFDVLIANYQDIDVAAAQAQSAGTGAPALLPVVARSMRHDPSLREHFSNFVLSGASLGQYLKSIDLALPGARR